MAIGNLKPIKLIQYSQTFDQNGDAIEEVAVIYKMWALVEDSGGSKSQSIGKTEMSDSKTFKVNFRNYLITGDYKIQYFGQIYAVTNIQRVQEKRFNYILTAFNLFESTSSVITPSNFTQLEYGQDTGVLTFTNGELGGMLLLIQFKQPNSPSTNYVNKFGEEVTTGAIDTNTLYWPLFTPPDSILVVWYLINPNTFEQVGPQYQQVVECTELAPRPFRIYRYNQQNQILYSPYIDAGVDVYNCVGSNIGYAVGIEQYINIQNADPVNAQYFQITDYELQLGGPGGPNYLLTCTPVTPFQQWNPGDTILYLQGDPV